MPASGYRVHLDCAKVSSAGSISRGQKCFRLFMPPINQPEHLHFCSVLPKGGLALLLLQWIEGESEDNSKSSTIQFFSIFPPPLSEVPMPKVLS
jgi:hypothetical protein